MLAAALAACGDRPRQSRDQGGIIVPDGPGRFTLLRPGADTNELYLRAMDLKTQGKCVEALDALRAVGARGPGYENAQTAAGECLIQKPGVGGEELEEGMAWLRRAGGAGWPEAQGLLARTHALGPEAVRDGEEAAFWLTLYETNHTKARLGFVPLSPADVAAIGMAITPEQKAAGARRASTWERRVLPPLPLPEREVKRGNPSQTKMKQID